MASAILFLLMVASGELGAQCNRMVVKIIFWKGLGMVSEICGQHQCNRLVKSAAVITVNKQYGISPLIRTMQVNE